MNGRTATAPASEIDSASVPVAALLLGHGSPDPAAQAELRELRQLVAARLSRRGDGQAAPTLGLGVLEFTVPGLPDLDAAFTAVASRQIVAAQPLLLFDGLHGRHDIPAVAARMSRCLSLEVRLGSPFGSDPALLGRAITTVMAACPGDGDVLLFVGRGSSEPRAIAQAEGVASAIAAATGMEHAVCHAGISSPDIAEGMSLALAGHPRRVIALPYLLHTGVLVNRVTNVVSPIAARERVELVVLPHLGNAPAIVDMLAARLEALL